MIVQLKSLTIKVNKTILFHNDNMNPTYNQLGYEPLQSNPLIPQQIQSKFQLIKINQHYCHIQHRIIILHLNININV